MIDNRPISPHLSIHKKILTSIFSIFHRLTGIGLSFGSLLICIWVVFLALGEDKYIFIKFIASFILFKIIMFLWTVGIFYHLFNGTRYLFWSLGYGLNLKYVYKTSYLVIILTILSTILVWVLI